ncbi:hypothetical protein Q7494_11235, partial [Glaesserella parasuis]|nr:hypothetical protein [Glaesserella parasuis]
GKGLIFNRRNKMISEQDKQAILNGACGISRDGYKCRYLALGDFLEFSDEITHWQPLQPPPIK